MAPPAAAGGRWAKLADWLYRHRGTTAVPFVIAALAGARPRSASVAVGLVLVLAGEWLRVRAVMAIGPHSRGRTLRAPRLATSGPYRWMRHPLYAGNGLVCAGLLLAANAFTPWLALGFAAAFAAQYGLFVRREERFLAGRWPDAWSRYAASVPALGIGPRRGSEAPRTDPAPPAGPSGRPDGMADIREAVRIEAPTLRTVAAFLIALWVRTLFRS